MANRARASGWAVYPEVGGWDLVLAAGDVQVGVHAKTRQSWRVLYQADPKRHRISGPTYCTILVPRPTDQFTNLAHSLGIGVYDGESRGPIRAVGAVCTPLRPLLLPVVESALPAGVPSPRSLTKWRELAIVLCGRLRRRGYLTGLDFRDVGVSRTLWLRRWLAPGCPGHEVVDGKMYARYELRTALRQPLPDVGYEADRDAVLAAYGEPV